MKKIILTLALLFSSAHAEPQDAAKLKAVLITHPTSLTQPTAPTATHAATALLAEASRATTPREEHEQRPSGIYDKKQFPHIYTVAYLSIAAAAGWIIYQTVDLLVKQDNNN